MRLDRFSWAPFVSNPESPAEDHPLRIMSYADDIFAVCPSLEAAKDTTRAIEKAAAGAGFAVSAAKTKVSYWPLDGIMPDKGRLEEGFHIGEGKITPLVNLPIKILGITLDPPKAGVAAIPSTAATHRSKKQGHAFGKLGAARKVWGTLAFPNSMERALFHCAPRSPLCFGRILSGATLWQEEFTIFWDSCLAITGVRKSSHVDALATMLEAGIIPPGLQTLLELADWYEAARNMDDRSPWHQAFVAEVLFTSSTPSGERTRPLMGRRVFAKALLYVSACSPWASYVAACLSLGLGDDLSLSNPVRPAYLPRPRPDPPATLPTVRSLCTKAFASRWSRGDFTRDITDPSRGLPSSNRYHKVSPSLPDASSWPRSEPSARVRHAIFALRLGALQLEEHNQRHGSGLHIISCGEDGCGDAPLTHIHLVCVCEATKVARAKLRRTLLRACESDRATESTPPGAILQAKTRIEQGISEDGCLRTPPPSAGAWEPEDLRMAWFLWFVGAPISCEEDANLVPLNLSGGSGLAKAFLKCLGHFALSVVSTAKRGSGFHSR